jgi:hypothetical protein
LNWFLFDRNLSDGPLTPISPKDFSVNGRLCSHYSP